MNQILAQERSNTRTIRGRLLPVTARVRARLFGSAELASGAAEQIELAPANTRFQPGAISLPDEFSRVLAFQEDTSRPIATARLQAGERRHAPTLAYRIDNTVLAQGTLYFKRGHQVFRPKSASPLLPRRFDHFSEAQLCTDFGIERYFGHWVRDGLLLELLATQQSLPALRFNGNSWRHEPGYRKLTKLDSVAIEHARVDRLWVIDDRGNNAGKLARLQELRRRLRSSITVARSTRVLLLRGRLGASRELINSKEVQEALEKLGFETIVPENEEPSFILEKLVAAEIAVFVEGSVQNHCLLAMPTGSTLLAIQPPKRFNAFSKTFADLLGINWAYVVAEPDENGFRLSVKRLLETLDVVTKVASGSAMREITV